MPSAFGYVRVSGQAQLDNASMEVQEQHLASLYQTLYRDNYVWGGIVPDPAVSAVLNDFAEREGGAALLLKASRGDLIIFYSVDRAFRTVRDAVNTMDAFQKRGIRVVFRDMGGQPIDMGTTAGQWLFHILAMVAQMSAQQLRSRCHEARVFLRSQGRCASQFPGFCLTSMRVANPGGKAFRFVCPDIKKRRVCQFIHRSKRAGHTYDAITDYMNANKLPVVLRGRTSWDRKAVENLHMEWLRQRKKEKAAGADGETLVLMPGGEVWSLARFDPRVQARIKADIMLANKAWGARKTELDTAF